MTDNENENEFFAAGVRAGERNNAPYGHPPFSLRKPGREADRAQWLAGWDKGLAVWSSVQQERRMLEQKRRDERITAHPTAALFPMMADDKLAELAADIKANGLKEPIVLEQYWFGERGTPRRRIVDGRARYAACLMAGVEPVFVTVEERSHLDILDHNIRRIDRELLRSTVRDLAEKILGPTPFPYPPRPAWIVLDPETEQAEVKAQMDYLEKHAPRLYELVATREFDLGTAASSLESDRTKTIIALLEMVFKAFRYEKGE
ncbi:MAG: ParB/Srx family N-terminal domain-containing protein [Methylocystis sp.]|jgi:hypothetical protein